MTGRWLTKKTGLLKLLELDQAKIVSVKNPTPGKWHLQVSADDQHTIRVTGLSTLDFVHGFSRHATLDLAETANQPIKGE